MEEVDRDSSNSTSVKVEKKINVCKNQNKYS